jgi:carbonic anhydrase
MAVKYYQKLIENNAEWAREMVAQDPEFFAKREASQTPHYLVIGCSDSRVPLELMTGALPGEMFVHRNIGNQVWETDLNVLSVLQFAVHVLDVEHVIVCGHSNCGALKASQGPASNGIIDNWLSDIRNVIRWHRTDLDACPDAATRLHKLSHLNVRQQVGILSRMPIILDAWSRGKRPMLHGWVYDIGSGLIERVVEQVDSQEKAAVLLPAN